MKSVVKKKYKHPAWFPVAFIGYWVFYCFFMIGAFLFAFGIVYHLTMSSFAADEQTRSYHAKKHNKLLDNATLK